MKKKWSKIKKLNPPNLTYKIKEQRDYEVSRRHRYEIRLLYWFATLKRMTKIRKERIQLMEREKTEIEKEIRKLQSEIEKRTDYQEELRDHIKGLNKEVRIYQKFFKKEKENLKLHKKPSFYIKTDKRKEGYEYYIGRIRYFQYKKRKRREKWVYFGSVSDMNRKYGQDKVKKVLKQKLEDIYYTELFGE